MVIFSNFRKILQSNKKHYITVFTGWVAAFIENKLNLMCNVTRLPFKNVMFFVLFMWCLFSQDKCDNLCSLFKFCLCVCRIGQCIPHVRLLILLHPQQQLHHLLRPLYCCCQSTWSPLPAQKYTCRQPHTHIHNVH